MIVTAFHELGHAITAACTGGEVEYIVLKKDLGGRTVYYHGCDCIVMSAGHLTASLVGALLVFCGFNLGASQVACFIFAACFIPIIFWTYKGSRHGDNTVAIVLGPTAILLLLFVILSGAAKSEGSRVPLKYFIVSTRGPKSGPKQNSG